MAGSGTAPAKSLLECLPPELVVEVASLLPPPSALCLLCCCRTLYTTLQDSATFWRRLCRRLRLCSSESDSVKRRGVEDWRTVFHGWRKAERRIRNKTTPFTSQRIVTDINSLRFKDQTDPAMFQKVLKLPEDAKVQIDFKTLKTSLIADNIFSHGLSDSHFVLLVSNCRTFKSHLSVWRLGQEITFSFSLGASTSPSHVLPNLWLASPEDLLVHDNLLILMATRAEPSNFFNESRPLNSDFIHIFNLDVDPYSPGFHVAVFKLPCPWVRLLPSIMKGGGGHRLLVWASTLLAVCPVVEEQYYSNNHLQAQAKLTIKLFDLSQLLTQMEKKPEQGQREKDEKKEKESDKPEQQVKEQEKELMQDQEQVKEQEKEKEKEKDKEQELDEHEQPKKEQEPLLLCPIFEETVEAANPRLAYSYLACDQKGSNVVLLFSKQLTGPDSLSQQLLSLCLSPPPSPSVWDSSTMRRLPSITGLGVRREEVLVAQGGTRGVFAVMDAAGLVTVRRDGVFHQFFPVYGVCEDFDTNYDELHIYNDRIVTLKIFQNRELSPGSRHSILAVSSLAGGLLWKYNTSLDLTTSAERLFLSPMFHSLFVSDARKAVIYDLETGVVRNRLQYGRYRRQGRELRSADPEVSAYSQTGFSVWDIRRVGGKIAVVHDIERVNPVIMDLVDIC